MSCLAFGEKGGGGGGDEDPSEQSAKPTTLIDAPQKKSTDRTMTPAQIDSLNSESGSKSQISASVAVALSKHEFLGNMKELDEQIATMMGTGDNLVNTGRRMKNGEWQMGKALVCQVCGKEGSRTNITNHIEANHVEGIAIPCKLCEKTYKSRNALRKHISVNHSNANI